VPLRDEGPQLAPPEPDSRAEVLREDAARGGWRSGGERDEGDGAGTLGEAGQAEDVADRREDVRELDRSADGRSGKGLPRQLDDERHLDRLAIEEDAVLLLPVVAEPFAVVGEEDDERPVVDPQLLQLVEKRADDAVRGRHLRVVAVGILRPVRLRRLVGRVGLVRVEKREEGA